MFRQIFYISIVTIVTAECVELFRKSDEKRFPDDFLFGVASSAYQIEGGWNADGKGPNIWDEFTHSHPERIADRQNGDVAANSYEYFMDDIAAIKNLNMNYYRFSIAWSRVLPDGDITNINENGIDYYNKLIDKLLEQNIEPMVTLYHFDLPQKLQTFGGFSNSVIIRYFESYANLLFERFGDRVKYWLTFNEPHGFCLIGYGSDRDAPAMNYSGVGEYLCAHNVLKSHAVAYQLYKKSFYDRYKGKVGITLNSMFYYSDTNDTEAVDRAVQFYLGWFANAIFSPNGNYPQVMIDRIGNNSKSEGRPYSRLPTFSRQWIEKIHGSADFLGLNYYSSRYVESLANPTGPNPSYVRDKGLKDIIKPEWKCSPCSVPRGLGDILRWIQKEYNNPEVFITENGWSDTGELEDNNRIEYLHDHLQEILDIVLNSECNLKGYTVWSIIDNFEWSSGYLEKFGLYSVNFNSSRKERTPKKSAYFMKEVTATRQIPPIMKEILKKE